MTTIPLAFRMPFVVRNLVRRWRRTLAATLGVGIALGLVITLLGLSNGGRYLLSGEYSESGIDLYIVARGGVVVPIQVGESPGTLDDARLLLNQLRVVPGVRQVIGTIGGSVRHQLERTPTGRADDELWPATGVWGDPTTVPAMVDLREGRWLRQVNEIVVGTTLADTKKVAVGDSVTLNDRRFRVVGIGRIRGLGYSSSSNAFLDYDALRGVNQLGDLASIIMVNADDPDRVAERIRAIRPLDVFTKDAVVQKVLDVTNTQAVFYRGVSVLSLGVAALFVGNVLTTAVNERRLEFATLRAIGIPRRTILLLVIAEAIVIALVAYLLGVALSTLLGELVNAAIAPIVHVDRIYVTDASLLSQVLAIALGLGVVSGLLPARAALRVQPAEALREA